MEFFTAWQRLCFGLPVMDLAQTAVCGRDGAFAYLARQGQASDPILGADRLVMQAALTRLRAPDPPGFLFVGLNDSDSAGHTGDYGTYLGVLAGYDAFLAELWGEVERLRAGGEKPVLLVTTDHGRGRGAEWTQHGWNVAGAHRAWLLAAGHGVARRGFAAKTRGYSLFDIRPTVELLLGLDPTGSIWGGVIADILEPRAVEDDDR